VVDGAPGPPPGPATAPPAPPPPPPPTPPPRPTTPRPPPPPPATPPRPTADPTHPPPPRRGQPNATGQPQEARGAFVGGLRYGDGTLYTKNAGDLRVFWQGPSLGFDAGADGARTMMLVYNLPRTAAIFDRFGGVDGSAYFIGGFGMTALTANNIVLVPIRSGVGLRLGANLGYLKFTSHPTWNPF